MTGQHFGMTLSEYLHSKRLSQRDFARAIGATEPTVSRWCNGVARPSNDAMIAIYRETGGAVTVLDFHPMPPLPVEARA
jgi:transcriptional regulator with XRE-family HTH domain